MSRGGGWLRAAIAVVVVVGADQLTKALAKGAIERGDGVAVFPGLELTNTRNRGIAFGALQDQGLVVAALIGAALLALVVYFALHAARAWLWLPVGMLLGGAAGNLIDRAREGAVVDFIDPVLWPAFNVADACIVVGVLALAYVAEGPPSRS